MQTKQDFKTPADLVKAGVELKVEAIDAARLIGTWSNSDTATRGLVKLVIARSGAGITVQAFGACTPTPCDWGVVAGIEYAADVSSTAAVAFSAYYKFSFKETIVVGHLDEDALRVETFDHFTDGSGRSNYYSRYLMRKE